MTAPRIRWRVSLVWLVTIAVLAAWAGAPLLVASAISAANFAGFIVGQIQARDDAISQRDRDASAFD